ncbi:FeoB-associated Cys-rich membrane protein [Bacillaceae bacterium S4-13-58]
MIFSWLVGVVIFSYAGYSLYRFIQKSKKGKCEACDLKEGCTTIESNCCSGVPTSEQKV